MAGQIDFGPEAVSFLSATQGWALGSGACVPCDMLWHTNDGGQRWQPISRPPLPGVALGLAEGLDDMFFATTRDGYIFTGSQCETHCVIATHDAGVSWRAVALPPISRLVSNGSDVYAVPDIASTHPQLWRSRVSSNTWGSTALPGDTTGIKITVEGDDLVVLQDATNYEADFLDRGQLWTSTDQGSHWQPRPNPCTAADGGAALVSIALGHPGALLVDCFDGEQSQQAIQTQHHLYGSADNGATWVRLADPAESGDPALLADNGTGHAFLATESGLEDDLNATVDGAARWHTAIRASCCGFFGWADLRFTSPSTGFILGPTHYATEHLYRTLDGGRTWGTIPLPRS